MVTTKESSDCSRVARTALHCKDPLVHLVPPPRLLIARAPSPCKDFYALPKSTCPEHHPMSNAAEFTGKLLIPWQVSGTTEQNELLEQSQSSRTLQALEQNSSL